MLRYVLAGFAPAHLPAVLQLELTGEESTIANAATGLEKDGACTEFAAEVVHENSHFSNTAVRYGGKENPALLAPSASFLTNA
jgi:hypothetical protein